jgi:hypothetical protein
MRVTFILMLASLGLGLAAPLANSAGGVAGK